MDPGRRAGAVSLAGDATAGKLADTALDLGQGKAAQVQASPSVLDRVLTEYKFCWYDVVLLGKLSML